MNRTRYYTKTIIFAAQGFSLCRLLASFSLSLRAFSFSQRATCRLRLRLRLQSAWLWAWFGVLKQHHKRNDEQDYDHPKCKIPEIRIHLHSRHWLHVILFRYSSQGLQSKSIAELWLSQSYSLARSRSAAIASAVAAAMRRISF
jgi:hypothetical protein